MELKMPSPEQAYWGLRAMKTVAMADGALNASEHHMMGRSSGDRGTTYAIEELPPPITPADLAQALPGSTDQTTTGTRLDHHVAD